MTATRAVLIEVGSCCEAELLQMNLTDTQVEALARVEEALDGLRGSGSYACAWLTVARTAEQADALCAQYPTPTEA